MSVLAPKVEPVPAGPVVHVGTVPGAGAEISVVVPAGEFWELLAVSVQLVQGLTQTPQPVLVIDDGANIVFESFGSSAAQAASTTAQYTWAPGLALSGLVGATPGIVAVAPLSARIALPAGWRVRTVTVGIGAATAYGAPNLYIDRYVV